MDDETISLSSANFTKVAAQQPVTREIVPLAIDRDVLAWMKTQGASIEHRINDLLRFYMHTHVFRDQEFWAVEERREATLPEQSRRSIDHWTKLASVRTLVSLNIPACRRDAAAAPGSAVNRTTAKSLSARVQLT